MPGASVDKGFTGLRKHTLAHLGIQNTHMLLKNLFPLYSLKDNLCKFDSLSMLIFSSGINVLIWGYFTNRIHQTRQHVQT